MTPLFFGLVCLALVAVGVNVVLFGVALSIGRRSLEIGLTLVLALLEIVQASVSLVGWSLVTPHVKPTIHVCTLLGPVTSITLFTTMLLVGLITLIRFTRIARKCVCDKFWIPLAVFFAAYIVLVVLMVVRNEFEVYPVSLSCPLFSGHSSLKSAVIFMLGLSHVMQIAMTLFSTIGLSGLDEVHMWPPANETSHRKSCYASFLTPHERQIVKKDPHDSLRSIACTAFYTAIVFIASILAIAQSSKVFPSSKLIDYLASISTNTLPIANPMFVLLTHASLYHKLRTLLQLSNHNTTSNRSFP